MSVPCSICTRPGLRKVIDGDLNEGVTGAGISRALASLGLTVTPDVINRHKTHYAPPEVRLKGTRKHDFAVKVRDRMSTAVDAIQPFTSEDGETIIDPILNKDFAPALGVGLKAQAIIDRREQTMKKQTGAEVLIALLRSLRGEATPSGGTAWQVLVGAY